MDMMKIGKFLSELRKEKNMTQEQLGEKVGVTNKTVSRWETGAYMPPVDALQILSELYGITINEMLSGQRLDETEYKQNAEENMKSALKKIDNKADRWDKIYWTFLVISTVVAIAVIELISKISGYAVIKVIVIVLVSILTFVTNTLNICLYVSEKDKWK